MTDWVFLVALVLSSLLAIWRGGRPERLCAAVLIAASVLSPLTQSDFVSVEYGIGLVDVALLVFLITLALRSNRYWPMFAAAFQSVGVLVHFVKAVDLDLDPGGYADVLVFWSYLILASLAIGSVLEGQKE